jgi:hypothetical protein
MQNQVLDEDIPPAKETVESFGAMYSEECSSKSVP